MRKIECIIVDDEPLALDLLEKYITKTPFLHLLWRCSNAKEALDISKNTQVDLLFLDIQMPEINGLELSRMINPETKVIFTTAYDEFALEGFKVNALDYLLKPFNYEEFRSSAEKAGNWFTLIDANQRPALKEFIFVKSEYRQLQIRLNDVLYFEGSKDYIKIWLGNSARPIMTLMSLKNMETELPADKFMRIHRSYIISLDRIQAIDRNHVIINNDIRIVIADPYKEKFQRFVNSRAAGYFTDYRHGKT